MQHETEEFATGDLAIAEAKKCLARKILKILYDLVSNRK